MSYIGNPLQSTSFQTDVFTGDASTTAFTLSRVPASVTSIVVFIDGVKQASIGGSGAYTLVGSTLNFTAAPPNNAVIEVIHLGVQSLVNVPADATVTASSLAPELRTILADQFTANGTGTTFVLTYPPISANSIIVTANGVVQYDYSLSGSTLILNFTPANGTLIRAAGMGNILTTGTITDDSVSTAKIQNNAVTTAKLSTTGVSAGTYGGASNVSVITVGVDGRITSATNVAFSSGAAISITNDVNTNADTFFPLLSNNVTSGTLAAANTSNTKLFYNANTGTLTATDFNSLSDISLKDNILYIQSPLSVIEKLSGVEFNWKDNGRKSSGFIAQEVEENLPHLVGSSKEGIKTVNYQGVIAYLVETVKQLNNRIKQLEKKNGIQD